MPIDVKICGLTDQAAVTAALEAGADMLGFVFFPPSPRHLEIERARPLADPARGRAKLVALSVDADDAMLDEVAEALDPDMFQLHGNEPPERAAAIRARYGRPVMKAVGVSGPADLDRAALYAPYVDRILFDAKPPARATRPGGLGRSFDWQLLAGYDCARPYMLSGGLDAESVARAAELAGAAGVDVSSGVESAPGVKDPTLIRRFVARMRAGEAADKERIAT